MGGDAGDDEAHVVLGTLVEFFGKRHNVYAMLAQGRTDRRRGSGFPGGDLELDKARNLLSHLFAPPKFVVDDGAAVRKISAVPPTGALPLTSKRDAFPLAALLLCRCFLRGAAALSGERPGLGHQSTGSAWSSSSSTGVSRPNMETVTRTRFFSTSISSTVPMKPSRGPSTMLTESPTL